MPTSKPTAPPRISVIILTHNRERMLAECLQALRRQTRAADEIIVVDNASTDGTRAMLTRLGEQIRIVDGGTLGSWASARNLGVSEASGDWVAFADDDCIPQQDWLERITLHLGEEGFDAVGGIVEPATPLPYPWWWHPEMGWTIGISIPGHKGTLAGSVYYPQTANWGARRDVLLHEPFQEIEADFASDSHIYRAGREDAELWRRLRRKGYRTMFDSHMSVRHRIEASRLNFRTLLARAFQDGVALQRREPEREYLRLAADSLISYPDRLLLSMCSPLRSPLRTAAWETVWAVRQWGQWVEAMRRDGYVKRFLHLKWLMFRIGLAKIDGACKRLGRKLGILGVRLVKRSKKKVIPRPRSIVVAAAGYVGDTVLLHPFLSTLKMQRPEVSISLITNGRGQQLFSHDPAISRIVVLERDFDAHTCDAILKSALGSSRADVVLVPYFYDFSPKGLFSRKEAPVITFSEEVGFTRRWWYDMADKRISKPNGRPEGENLYRLFSEAGLQGRLQQASLAFSPDELDAVATLLRAEDLGSDNMIVVAPGSGKANKLWVEERWGEIVAFLEKEYDARVVIQGSASEEEMCRRISRLGGGNAIVWCHLDLRQLALVLASARLVLTVDSGVKHLAVAMETPTLTLWGPTDERQWGPIREPHRHGAIRGCTWDLSLEERIGLAENHQMQCISVERVKRALAEMLGEH